jgi:polysaccharide chain length determinant protein (PEP-CTERM system associated)
MNIQNITPRDLADMGGRRKWFILSSIVIAIAAASAVAVFTPRIYRSATTIMVETQRIPERYVNSVVSGTVSDRISVVQQSVLSRPSLEKIAVEFKLFPANATLAEQESQIEGLRKNIKIETKAQRGDVRVESFTLSFADMDPIRASQVTNHLAMQIIDENLKSREQMVAGTTSFLDQELAHAMESLEKQEQAIAIFKKRHVGELPGQTAANLQTLDRLQRDITNVNDALQNRNDRRAALLKLINSYELMGLIGFDQMREAGSGQDSEEAGRSRAQGSVSRVPRGTTGDSLTQRLRDLERQLTTLSAEYKDTYPDVVQLKKEIAQVKLRIVERNGQAAQEESGGPETVRAPESGRSGVVKRASGSALDPYLFELKREKEEIEIGISTLKDQQRRLEAQIKEYAIRVEKVPEREQELLVLERDYSNTKRNYETLLEKQLNARISENLERRQQGETFRIIEPANVPSRPESPDVMKIMLVGLLAGCGIGVGGAFVLEQLAGVFHKAEDVENVLGLPVLATIPDFKSAYSDKSRTPLLPSYSTTPDRVQPEVAQLPYTDTSLKPEKSGTAFSWKKASTGENGNHKKLTPDALKLELNVVAKWKPHSLVAEQFRVAATRVVLSSSDKKNFVVVVTSAMAGEGKSATASNLAYVLAQDLGKRTLLVDCDFKRPVLHAYNGISMRPGLAEAIFGDAPLDSCLHRCGDTSLWILPAGRRDHRLVDLSKIAQLTTIVTELKEKFDIVIIDAPPILPLADMNLLASIADMLLIVVRSGVTPQDMIEKAVKSLSRPSIRAGVILTGYGDVKGMRYIQQSYAIPGRTS